MSEAPDMPEVIPVATPQAQPEPEAPAVEAVEIAEEPEAPAAEPEAAAEQPTDEHPKKSPVAQLKGRVSYLTKTLHEKDEELAQARAQLATFKAIAENSGGEAPPPVQPDRPAPGSTGFDDAVKSEAQRLASESAFTNACNETFAAGKAEFGDDFAEAVSNLNATGLAQRDLIEAALATEAAPKVLHFLGQDLDEAARIAALPPARKGVELAKIAARLSAPPPKPQISNAPPPITPLGGNAKPTLDIYDDAISDDEYWERRAKMGAPYVRLKGRG